MKNIFLAALITVAALPAFAQLRPNTNAPTGVIVAWDFNAPNPTNPVTGYRVYKGTATRMYSEVVNAGNSNRLAFTNLVAGTTYYFAATAYNATGNESDFSSEVSYLTPTNPPAPGGMRTIWITNSLQSAISPEGPFDTLAQFVQSATIPADAAHQFVRNRSDVKIE